MRIRSGRREPATEFAEEPLFHADQQRVGSEVLGITVHCHRDLERLLRGFNAAYNARRQRVLDSKTPDQVVAERIEAESELARASPHGRADPCDLTRARLVAESAKEVSQPDS